MKIKSLIGTCFVFSLILMIGFNQESAATNTAQTLPFSQDWFPLSQITVDDDWSGVPGITGYRGDGLTVTTGIDPQTILAPAVELTDTPAGVIDVNANIVSTLNLPPITSGGVTELSDGAYGELIVLKGTGTADAPFLLISIDTLGKTQIDVNYNLLDVDDNTPSAVQQFALQYRVGTSGNFVNIPGGYVADATDSFANLLTAVSVQLPVNAENEPIVQLRIITANAVGTDEWVGIDDIVITGVIQAPVGSISIPLDSTSLLLADTQSFSWMIPVVLSVLGIGLFVIRRR